MIYISMVSLVTGSNPTLGLYEFHWVQEMNLRDSARSRCELVPIEGGVGASLIFLGIVSWLKINREWNSFPRETRNVAQWPGEFNVKGWLFVILYSFMLCHNGLNLTALLVEIKCLMLYVFITENRKLTLHMSSDLMSLN